MRPGALALALLFAGVHAEAAPARVERCEVRLHLEAGAVDLAGHGATPEAAWRSAERVAASVAAIAAHAELLGGLVTDPERALARYLDRLDVLGSDLGPAPGYRVERGTCARLRLPRNPEGHAWSVAWRDGDTAILRDDPAVATEAARRRACFGAFQREAHAAFAHLESDAPWRDVVTPLRDARDALLRCVAAPTPTPRPAVAPLPDPEASGVWACHRPRRHEGAWTLSPGFGATVEEAREAALMRDALVVTRRATGAAMARLLGPPDPEGLREVVDPLRTLVVGSDVAEQNLLLCAVAPPAPLDFAWTPPESCGPGEAPISLQASAPALERLAGERCDQVLHGGVAATAARLVGARRRDGVLALQGLGTALQCAASCSTDLRTRGWTPVPAVRPGDVDRTTADRAAAALETALALRDLPSFGAVTGGVMLHPLYVRAERDDPESFWGSLLEVVREGRLSEIARWEHVAGQWLLTFE